MPLEALPVEILNKIFEHIAENLEYLQHPLANVSLSCRLFHELTQPFLYNVVSVPCALRIDNLLRALVRRPSLVGFIKSFDSPTVQPGWKKGPRVELEGKLDLSFMEEPQHEWMRSNLRDDVYGQEVCDVWYQKLISGDWDAILGFLLLVFSPNLQRLTLWSALSQSSYMWLVLEGRPRNSTQFRS